MKRRKECRCRGSRSRDLRHFPVVARIRRNSVALEEKRQLSLQIIARYQQRSPRRLQLGILKKVRQCCFQCIWGIFWKNQLSRRREEVLAEYRRAILHIKVQKLTRRIRRTFISLRADSQRDDAARGCPRNQIKCLPQILANAFLQFAENHRRNDPAYSAAIDRQNLDAFFVRIRHVTISSEENYAFGGKAVVLFANRKP